MIVSVRWLSRAMVEAMHAESLERFGGSTGLRDPGLLESALARPRNPLAYEPETDLFQLAAAYCAGIISNHPFIDGNKRAGILAVHGFLWLNGWALRPDERQIVTMIVDLAAGKVTPDQLADWLRETAKQR